MKKPKISNQKPASRTRRSGKRLKFNRYDSVLALVVIGSLLAAPASVKWLIAVPIIFLRTGFMLLNKRKIRAREQKLLKLISDDVARRAERATQSIRLTPALEPIIADPQAVEVTIVPPPLPPTPPSKSQQATQLAPAKPRGTGPAAYRRRHHATISRRVYL